MRIKLLLVGKNKDGCIESQLTEYQKRLKAFVTLEIKYLKEGKVAPNAEEQKKAEAEIILSELSKDDYLILLDEKGDELTSLDFAGKVTVWQQSGKKSLVFLVGGPYGVSKIVREKANATVSLSAMTFTHQMARVFFVEQLYRAFTIIHKMPYHH